MGRWGRGGGGKRKKKEMRERGVLCKRDTDREEIKDNEIETDRQTDIQTDR